jgi:pyruvate dehydrogenase E1 component alpha subunit
MPNADLLSLYRVMLRIRCTEETIANRYAEQQIRCPVHLCIGQEAIAAGVCAALKPEDVVFSNHRAHGHYLAKGGSMKAMVAELYGRATGCCGGRGGSMHLIDLDAGFMGATPIVGGTVPLAVGAAWASSLKGERKVGVAFFGDGCFEEGIVHESMNFSALHKLPVLFVCENNNLSVYTPLKDRQPARPIHVVAKAHGWGAWCSDGNDVEAVLGIACEAVDRARGGAGPQFLEFETYRWREHCGPNFDDKLDYRSTFEVVAGKAGDPLVRAQEKLLREGRATQSDLDKLKRVIVQEIEWAFEHALSSPAPTYVDAAKGVYAQ